MPTAAADAAAREVIDAFYAAIGRGDRPGHPSWVA